MSDIFKELSWRGLVFDSTVGLAEMAAKEKFTLYNGFDPTADSMHVGHLVPMVALARFQRAGHTPIALAGGGTGMIGDPSGRSSERNLLTNEQIESNLVNIKQQLASILDFEVKSNPAMVVNNADWLREISMIDFLRDVGKHFTVNYMMGKESVKNRLDREDGLSYTEFSYMLLQAYDFLHLHREYGCRLQAGGSDQWGNIVAGTTLIRKTTGSSAEALVYPLITRADGKKFGKSETGDSIWLSPERTSPYRFYQFFINLEDAKVVEALRFYTFLTEEEIAEYVLSVAESPHERAAQKRVAQEVTRMVHGDTALDKAVQASSVLFGGSMDGLDSADIRDIFANVPSSTKGKNEFAGEGLNIVDLLVATGLATSKSDARRSVEGGAMNINNQRVTEVTRMVSATDMVDGQFIVLRKGRKKYHLVQIAE